MLRDHAKVFKQLMIFADICAAAGSFIGAYYIAARLGDPFSLASYLRIIVPFTLTWGILLHFLGMYESFRTKRTGEVIFIIVEAALIGIGGFGIFLYFLSIQYVSRGFIFTSFALTGAIFAVEKLILISFFRNIRKKDYNTRSLLIVGTGNRAARFVNTVNERPEWGLKILGFVDEDASRVGSEIEARKVIGSLDDIPNILHNNVVDEVVFIVPRSSLDKIEKYLRFCEVEGVKISVAVDYFDLKFARAKQTDLGGFPLLTFERVPDKIWHLFFKRVFDLAVSGSGLIILSPLFLTLAIIVKTTSQGPVFFGQKRVGLNGRQFTLYKFRTMVKDAEYKLQELKGKNEMNGPVFKISDDPRLTPIGKFLRKFSMDELPQLWNVFKGEMSLVGPRPPIPQEVDQYDNWQRRRLSMRPGLTCLWQVNGRNKITDFNDWARLDLEYIDKWSLGLDFQIFFRTIPVVVFGIGAK